MRNFTRKILVKARCGEDCTRTYDALFFKEFQRNGILPSQSLKIPL